MSEMGTRSGRLAGRGSRRSGSGREPGGARGGLAQQRDALAQVVGVGTHAAHLQTGAHLLFQAPHRPLQIVEAALD